MRISGPVSAVDRLHTALHGYFRSLCIESGITVADDASLTALFKVLRTAHPILKDLGSYDNDLVRVLHGFANAIDAINSLRNNGSIAHPSDDLLGEPEAHLAANATRTIFNYIRAKSYRAAIEHFEVQWKGMLPATADGVASYLAEYADTLAVSTLRQRLAALAQWHTAQGFPDPTKAPIVRQAMRGIRALHPAQEKQAKPLQLDELERVVGALDRAVNAARRGNDRAAELRSLRDKSLILLGFWRGFRSDELSRLRVEHVEASAGEGITCFLGRTKGDRQNLGSTFRAPALSRLCPVEAYLNWIGAAQLTAGNVYRAIDRWGHVGESGLHIDSIAP
eukprot:gene9964-9770_t